MQLPQQEFFKDVRFNPLVVDFGAVLKASDSLEHSYGSHINFNGAVYRLKQDRFISEYDEEFFEHLRKDANIQQQLNAEIDKIAKKKSDLMQKMKESILLNFVRLVFMRFDPGLEKEYKHSAEPLLEKFSLHKSDFMLLSDMFSSGNLESCVLYGERIKQLTAPEEPVAVERDYVQLSDGTRRRMIPAGSLAGLERLYYSKVRQKIKEHVSHVLALEGELRDSTEKLEALLTQFSFSGEYEGAGAGANKNVFGFMRVDDDPDINARGLPLPEVKECIWLEVPPHAYNSESMYYCFEKTKIGVKVRVENGDIIELDFLEKKTKGNLLMNVGRPFFLYNDHLHPAHNKNDHTVCLSGRGKDEQTARELESLFRIEIQDEQLTELERKARKYVHFLQHCRSSIMAGVRRKRTEGLGIWYPFDNPKPDVPIPGYLYSPGLKQLYFEKTPEQRKKSYFKCLTEPEFKQWQEAKTPEWGVIHEAHY